MSVNGVTTDDDQANDLTRAFVEIAEPKIMKAVATAAGPAGGWRLAKRQAQPVPRAPLWRSRERYAPAGDGHHFDCYPPHDRVAANLTELFSALEGVTLADQERKAFTNLAFFAEAAVVADVFKRVRGQC